MENRPGGTKKNKLEKKIDSLEKQLSELRGIVDEIVKSIPNLDTITDQSKEQAAGDEVMKNATKQADE